MPVRGRMPLPRESATSGGSGILPRWIKKSPDSGNITWERHPAAIPQSQPTNQAESETDSHLLAEPAAHAQGFAAHTVSWLCNRHYREDHGHGSRPAKQAI